MAIIEPQQTHRGDSLKSNVRLMLPRSGALATAISVGILFFALLIVRSTKTDLLIAICYALFLGTLVPIVLKLSAKNREAASFVPKLFVWSFGIRTALAVGINIFIKQFVTYDAPTYEEGGQNWSAFWHGQMVKPPVTIIPHVQLTAQIVGIQYYLTGNNVFIPDITNALIGAFVPLVVYDMGRRLFDSETAGRAAAVFATLNVACVIWSAIAVRDIYIVLLVALGLNEVTRLMRCSTLVVLLRLALWMGLLNLFRPYAVLILIVSAGMSYAVLVTKKPLARIAVVVLIGCVLGGLTFSGGMPAVLFDLMQTQTDQLSEARSIVTYQTTQDQGYAPGVDYKSVGDVLKFLPTGLFYFWGGPFLFGYGVRQVIFALPEVISWYVTFWFGLRGYLMLRGRDKYILPLTTFFFMGSILLAVICGNFAETIRVRSMLTVPLQLLAGVGWVRRKEPLLPRPMIATTIT